MIHVLHGPRRISTTHVVTVPTAVVRASGVRPSTQVYFDIIGDKVFIKLADDDTLPASLRHMGSMSQVCLPEHVLAALDIGQASLVYVRVVGDAIEIIPAHRINV